MSLLIALVGIGAILYFALKGADPHTHAGGSETGNAVHCEPLLTKLVQQTGGVGPAAKTAWDQLPPECRRLMPDPAALAPTPSRSEEAQ